MVAFLLETGRTGGLSAKTVSIKIASVLEYPDPRGVATNRILEKPHNVGATYRRRQAGHMCSASNFPVFGETAFRPRW
ncbi:hypothetical protein GCM10007937_04410 [Mesorhizobium albiziae]|nr:hypothetical protein GCM10007937_04410 [Mesorhizobium albiziae]